MLFHVWVFAGITSSAIAKSLKPWQTVREYALTGGLLVAVLLALFLFNLDETEGFVFAGIGLGGSFALGIVVAMWRQRAKLFPDDSEGPHGAT